MPPTLKSQKTGMSPSVLMSVAANIISVRCKGSFSNGGADGQDSSAHHQMLPNTINVRANVSDSPGASISGRVKVDGRHGCNEPTDTKYDP
jgi:hypothetical protein